MTLRCLQGEALDVCHSVNLVVGQERRMPRVRGRRQTLDACVQWVQPRQSPWSWCRSTKPSGDAAGGSHEMLSGTTLPGLGYIETS